MQKVKQRMKLSQVQQLRLRILPTKKSYLLVPGEVWKSDKQDLR